MAKGKRIRVGNAGGYWGDELEAMERQLRAGWLDYLTLDFLAEITMSILQKQRSRNPALGYARDFLDQMRVCLPLLARAGTKVISNAGGINPRGCARALAEIAESMRLSIPIVAIEGDDLMNRLDELLAKGLPLRHMETGQELAAVRDKVQSANVYLGAAPVLKALEAGGQLIVTGRVTDTGIAAAAPAFEFGWSLSDWDRLAAGVVAGHILECGAQASGGNLTDWKEVGCFQEMGYPIADFEEDGSFEITKHPGTGGVINVKTVSEQLVYEMGDPRRYVTPDVVADFTSIRLRQKGPDRVRVEGVKGVPPTGLLKVSVAYQAGYKAHGTMIISRPEAAEKARAAAEIFWDRLALSFEETSTELVGYNACHGPLVEDFDPPEVLLRLGVRDGDGAKVEAFAKKFTSLILSTVPGIAIVGARPKVQEVVAYWPCLIPAEEVTPRVWILSTGTQVPVPALPLPARAEAAPDRPAPGPEEEEPPPEEGLEVPLRVLAYARSGDKGDTANIGVVARSREAYQWMRVHLTPGRVKRHFEGLCRGAVERYEVPNLLALNFLLHEALGGGGTVSLRIDPQGKTLSQALLLMPVKVPREVLESVGATPHGAGSGG